MDTITEEIKMPFVSTALLEYLQEHYTMNRLMHLTVGVVNNDERMGFFKGVADIIGLLSNIHMEQERK